MDKDCYKEFTQDAQMARLRETRRIEAENKQLRENWISRNDEVQRARDSCQAMQNKLDRARMEVSLMLAFMGLFITICGLWVS